MGRIDDRLAELGLTLPEPMEPPGNFRLVTVHAGVAYVAGHPPISGTEILVHGVVGRDLTVDEGYKAARLTALSVLASLKQELGELDRVTGWLRAVGYVQTAPDFHDNAKVVKVRRRLNVTDRPQPPCDAIEFPEFLLEGCED